MKTDLFRRTALLLGASLALTLAACGGGEMGEELIPKDGAPKFPAVMLTLVHVNDHHSQLDAFAATELTLDGVATQVELGGFARQTALFKSLAGTKNLLKIHAGDAKTSHRCCRRTIGINTINIR